MPKSIKDTAQDRLFAEAKRQSKLRAKEKKAASANYGYSTKTKVDEAASRVKSAGDTEEYMKKKLGK